jgi:hypothetical protein
MRFGGWSSVATTLRAGHISHLSPVGYFHTYKHDQNGCGAHLASY